MKFRECTSLKPATHPERCSKVRFSGSRCDKCFSVCPTHSILFTYPTLRIDDRCSGCGFCVAACPGEVFALPAYSPGFTKNGEQAATLHCSGLLARGPSPANLLPPSTIPCLGSIPSSFILRRVLQEEKSLEILTGACDDCSMKTGEKQYRQREREIQSLFGFLGIGFPPAMVSVGSAAEGQEALRQYEAFHVSMEEKKVLSRRDFFRHLHDRALTNRSEMEGKDTLPGEVEPGYRGPTEAARCLIELFKRYCGGVSGKDKVPGFTEIHVDENCTGCGACASLCPTGALTIDEGSETVQLLWTPAHCSHCDLCFDACSRKALHMLPCLDANKIVGETRSAVREFHRHVCPECGNSFLSSGTASLCSDCSKAGNLLNAVSMMIYGEGRRTAP